MTDSPQRLSPVSETLLRLAEILASVDIDDDAVTVAFTPFERDQFVAALRGHAPTPAVYPSAEAMKAAVTLEIHAALALGGVPTVTIGQLIQKVIDAALADTSTERNPVEFKSDVDLSEATRSVNSLYTLPVSSPGRDGK